MATPSVPVGLCFGRRASGLPTPGEVLQSYMNNGFPKMLVTPTEPGVVPLLQAIRDDENARPKMQVVLCIEYSHLANLQESEGAERWFREYVADFQSFITHICVGNVVGPDDFTLSVLLKAMHNIKTRIPASIKLSAIVNISILGGTYQADTWPSDCRLTPKYVELFRELSKLNGSPTPLFVRIMPYFMIRPGVNVNVQNFLLSDNAPPYFWDGNNKYNQVFDAMLDGICVALRSENQLDSEGIHVVTGWPTAGPNENASPQNAGMYRDNLNRRASWVTPRGNKPADIFIYSLLDENLLETAIEEYRHLGINLTPTAEHN